MSYHTDKIKMGQVLILKLNLTLKVKVNHQQKYRDLNQVFYTYSLNLVILVWMGDD